MRQLTVLFRPNAQDQTRLSALMRLYAWRSNALLRAFVRIQQMKPQGYTTFKLAWTEPSAQTLLLQPRFQTSPLMKQRMLWWFQLWSQSQRRTWSRQTPTSILDSSTFDTTRQFLIFTCWWKPMTFKRTEASSVPCWYALWWASPVS